MEAAFQATKQAFGRLVNSLDRRTTEQDYLSLLVLPSMTPTSTAIAVMMLTTLLPDSWEGLGSTGSVL